MKWIENELPWQDTGFLSDFDDCVSQTQMFLEAKEDTSLIVLSYAPNLRTFLHRKKIDKVQTWSFFDELQGIYQDEVHSFAWQDFSWPKNIRWVYTGPNVLGFIDNERYARLLFGENGNVIHAEIKPDSNRDLRVYFDDRGLVSSIVEFKDGVYQQHTFYDPEGNWRFNQQIDGSIQINPEFGFIAKQLTYPSIETLMEEKLNDFLDTLTIQDTLVVTAHPFHTNLFSQKANYKKVVSFYRERYDQVPEHIQTITTGANLVICDNEQLRDTIKSHIINSCPVVNISPFDARFELGKSQRINELKIYIPLEDQHIETVIHHIRDIFNYMETRKRVQLVFSITPANPMNKDQLTEYLEAFVDSLRYDIVVYNKRMEDIDPTEEVDEDAPEMIPQIFIEELEDENALFKVIEDVRLMVDIRKVPDVFTQIACISTGIPQIICETNEYVAHKQNGYILAQGSLDDALHYYLDQLANWNEALVYSFHKKAENTGANLVAKWKEQLYETQ